MDTPQRHEYYAIAIATLVLLVVLIASYMCLVLYGEKSAGPCEDCPCPPGGGAGLARFRPSGREGFLEAMRYRPACGSSYADMRRAECRGFTSGSMPAIEGEWAGGGLCPGVFLSGVPP